MIDWPTKRNELDNENNEKPKQRDQMHFMETEIAAIAYRRAPKRQRFPFGSVEWRLKDKTNAPFVHSDLSRAEGPVGAPIARAQEHQVQAQDEGTKADIGMDVFHWN